VGKEFPTSGTKQKSANRGVRGETPDVDFSLKGRKGTNESFGAERRKGEVARFSIKRGGCKKPVKGPWNEAGSQRGGGCSFLGKTHGNCQVALGGEQLRKDDSEGTSGSPAIGTPPVREKSETVLP